MQKKKILEAVLPSVKKESDTLNLIADLRDIGGATHVIADLYDGNTRKVRYAVNDNEASRYVYEKNRWSKAESQNIDLNGCTGYWINYSESSLQNKVRIKAVPGVSEFLECTKKEIYKTILSRINHEKDKEHKRKIIKADIFRERDMNILPDLDISEDIKRDWQDINKIAYRVKGNNSHFICLQCGGQYDKKVRSPYSNSLYPTGITRPSKGEEGKCSDCGCTATLFPQGRYRGIYLYRWYYVWQKIPDGCVLRIYYTNRTDHLGAATEIEITECVREFFRIGDYKLYVANNGGNWYMANSDLTWSPKNGKVYGDPFELGADTIFRYMKYDEVLSEAGIRNSRYTEDIRWYMKQICKHPNIEYFIKLGMPDIAKNILQGWRTGIRPNAKNLADKLGVYPERVKDIQRNKGNLHVLKMYQWERKQKVRIKPDDIGLYEEAARTYDGLEKLSGLLTYISMTHLKNLVKKYAALENWTESRVLSEYYDYLILRQELGYDMKNTVYLNPNSLSESHNGMVKEKEDRKNSKRLEEVRKNYPHISSRFKKLDKKYHYSGYGYVIRPALSAEEIVREGWYLHHCVGNNSYLDKHNTGKTSILMLRDEKEPEIPYVTIEIDNAGNVIQWYAAHDSKNVTADALCCIEEFTERIKPKNNKRSA